jgi:hypothetical protein
VGPLSKSGCTSTVVFRYNVWDGAACGTSDVNAPSGFVDANRFDLRLTPSSAAVDHGDPENFPPTDIDGQTRPLGSAPDAGADELS